MKIRVRYDNQLTDIDVPEVLVRATRYRLYVRLCLIGSGCRYGCLSAVLWTMEDRER